VTNRPGWFARLWIAHVVTTLLVCAGAITLVQADGSLSSNDSVLTRIASRCVVAAPDGAQALSAGALAPEAPDSTDDDDDDDGDEMPSGSMVLPGRPVAAESITVEFIEPGDVAATHSPTVDSHSLRAPPAPRGF
jgi:hypothetical protein